MTIESQYSIGKIPHRVIVRAPGLLPMLYRATELAEDLGVSIWVVRQWAKKGMPYRRDARGHLWITGVEFANWVEVQRGLRRGPALGQDEAYCLPCKQAVKLIKPTRRVDGKRVLLQAICPQCGSKINKGVPCGEST
jgi:hypothetical protein